MEKLKSASSINENRLIHTLALLGDKTRFRIFKLLSKDSELCVSQIAEKLDISTSAVSQHFKSFEMLGLVTKHRSGQKICYELIDDDELVVQLTKLTKEN